MIGKNPSDDLSGIWHKTQFRVPLYEVDLGQGVYHGNYFHLFEQGREAFLRDLGYSYRRFMDQRLHLTIVEVSCSYRQPVLYDDVIEVHTGIKWLRTRSLSFVQAIYRQEENREPVLCTEATLNMVCIRFNGQPSTLPMDFVDMLKDWVEQGRSTTAGVS